MHLRNTRISLLSVYCIASSINNTVLHWILLCPISYVSSPLLSSTHHLSLPPSLSHPPSRYLSASFSISLSQAHMQELEESFDYKSAPQLISLKDIQHFTLFNQDTRTHMKKYVIAQGTSIYPNMVDWLQV